MNAKSDRKMQTSTASQSQDRAGAYWPETVERRIGLDVQDGMMSVTVIDGEYVDASTRAASSSDAAFMASQEALRHRPRRLRLRRLAHGKRLHRQR